MFAHECIEVCIAFFRLKIFASKQSEWIDNFKKSLLISHSILFTVECGDSPQHLPKRFFFHKRFLTPSSRNIFLKNPKVREKLLLAINSEITIPFLECFGIQAYMVVEQYFLLHYIFTVQFSLRGCIDSTSPSISPSSCSFIINYQQ